MSNFLSLKWTLLLLMIAFTGFLVAYYGSLIHRDMVQFNQEKIADQRETAALRTIKSKNDNGNPINSKEKPSMKYKKLNIV